MLSKQITQGRFTADPELKTTQSGVPVCSFTIASEDDVKQKDGTRATDFIDCVAWRGTAEFISKYFTKGQMILVMGRPKPRTYKDKNDVTHKVTELRVETAYFCDSKKDGDQSTGGQTYAAPNFGTDDFVTIPNDEDLPF